MTIFLLFIINLLATYILSVGKIFKNKEEWRNIFLWFTKEEDLIVNFALKLLTWLIHSSKLADDFKILLFPVQLQIKNVWRTLPFVPESTWPNGKSFATVNMLNHHIKRIHEKSLDEVKIRICNLCQEEFKSRYELNNHKLRVH